MNLLRRFTIWVLLSATLVVGLLSYTSIETAEGRTPQRRMLLLFGGQPTFNPASIATLRGRYDFDDLTTMFQDTAGTSPVTASGQTIQRINNKVVGGPYFSQAAGPTYNTFNGSQLGAVFNGSSNYLVSSDTNYWKFLTDGTRYVVIMQGMITAQPSSAMWWLNSENNSVSNVGISMYSAGGANYQTTIRSTNGAGAVWISNTTSNNAIALNTAFVMTMRCQDSSADTNDCIIRVGGVAVASGDRTASPSAGNPTFALCIGALPSLAGRLNGRIRRLWIWELPSNYPDDFIPLAEAAIVLP